MPRRDSEMAHIAFSESEGIYSRHAQEMCCALAGALAAIPAGAYVALLPTWENSGEIVLGWSLVAMAAVGAEWLADEIRG